MEPADQRHQRGPYQLFEHRFLVLEVQIDRALGDAGAPGDIVKPGRGESARDELLQCGVDDGLPPLQRALRPAGWRVERHECLLAGYRRGSLPPAPAFGRLWSCFRAGWSGVAHRAYMTDQSVIVNRRPAARVSHRRYFDLRGCRIDLRHARAFPSWRKTK